MKVIKTKFPGLFVIEPDVFGDDRGWFFESYNKEKFLKHGITNNFVQDNFSYSKYGVVRGLHYQLEPYSQAKLVQVLKGKVLDVAVDLRKGSPTFGKVESVILSEQNRKQFLIPKGFAHGFSVLSEDAVFNYKCDNTYNKDSEGGIHYMDDSLNIDWMIPKKDQIISSKDELLPNIEQANFNFNF